MLKKLWDMAVALLTLAQDLKQYRQEQEKINDKLRDLTIIVHALASVMLVLIGLGLSGPK